MATEPPPTGPNAFVEVHLRNIRTALHEQTQVQRQTLEVLVELRDELRAAREERARKNTNGHDTHHEGATR